MTYFAIFRLYPEKPGCVDYMGTIPAESADAAEMIAALHYGVEDGSYFDIEEETAAADEFVVGLQ